MDDEGEVNVMWMYDESFVNGECKWSEMESVSDCMMSVLLVYGEYKVFVWLMDGKWESWNF